SEGTLWLESFGAAIRNVLVLFDSVAADADGSDKLPLFIKRHSSGKFDDAVGHIAVSNLPQRSSGLGESADRTSGQGILIAAEGHGRESLAFGNIDASQPGVHHGALANDFPGAIDYHDVHLGFLLFAS